MLMEPVDPKDIKSQFSIPTPTLPLAEIKRLGVDQIKHQQVKVKSEDDERQAGLTIARYDIWDFNVAETGQNSVVLAITNLVVHNNGTILSTIFNPNVYPGWNLVSLFVRF